MLARVEAVHGGMAVGVGAAEEESWVAPVGGLKLGELVHVHVPVRFDQVLDLPTGGFTNPRWREEMKF